MIFNQLRSAATGRHFALAIALATGSVVAMSGIVSEPVEAKKKKKKKGKAQYSAEYIAAYKPIDESLQAGDADLNAIKAQFPALIALSISPDERLATGSTVHSVGGKLTDRQMQFDGMKMMLESGKVPAENLGQYNFIAYQLARAIGQHGASRGYLEQAINNNFTTATINPAAMRIQLAETFFAEDRYREGLGNLKQAIEDREAAGLEVDESWYRRGLSVGFNNEIQPEVNYFVNRWVAAFPETKNWRDAVNITRQLNEYNAGATLDILRLGFKIGTLQDKIEYADYVESADPRRLPKEVEAVIQQGYATGNVSRDDIYIADSLKVASGRIRADKAELPALLRDARAGNAGLRTVLAAGDAFLNYDEHAKAEEFYSKALGMPGVDTAQTLTRLGIAQMEMGKYAEAKANFAKVQGTRAAIAQLWMTYIDEQTAAAEPVAPAIMAEPASEG